MGKKTSPLKFILGNKQVEIDFNKHASLRPTTTVLQYLRDLPDRKGTKEGCAEGDCGACTVVLGSLDDDGNIQYEAIDCCLVFLPMLHGKWLITVEDIGNSSNLHPVQQAMVDYDGSQCGYCTPGFVMSMFSLYKNHKDPSREVIDDALTGNLCRCTGYRSIVEATSQSFASYGADKFGVNEEIALQLLKKIEDKNLRIETEDQRYFKPFDLPTALKWKAEFPNALVLNGATDLALRVTKNHEQLLEILDIGSVKELQTCEEFTDHIMYGAGLSLEQVNLHTEKYFPALQKMLAVFGSLQIRNLATLGGNLCSASPIGDIAPVLIALDATVILQNQTGKREVSIHEFITGYRQTVLAKDELMEAVKIPISAEDVIIESYKISKRKDLDISTVSTGFRLNLDEEEKVEEICLAYGGMADMTKRAERTEQFLTGKTWNRVNVEAAMEIIDEDFTPISDARSGKAARRVMARNLVLKFWSETVKLNASVV